MSGHEDRWKINRGAWLRWWYENMSEADYLDMLRAVRADQRDEARAASLSAGPHGDPDA